MEGTQGQDIEGEDKSPNATLTTKKPTTREPTTEKKGTATEKAPESH